MAVMQLLPCSHCDGGALVSYLCVRTGLVSGEQSELSQCFETPLELRGQEDILSSAVYFMTACYYETLRSSTHIKRLGAGGHQTGNKGNCVMHFICIFHTLATATHTN